MKAIALISGGLDGILAAKLIKDQGIEVIAVYFRIPFSRENRNLSVEELKQICSDNLGAELKIVDISNEFLDLLIDPKYGFGANMNPCIDCKILMLRKAGELMLESKAEFVVTGEVLGQRPMSQRRDVFRLMDKDSRLEGLVLRPLSAGLLDETIPEQECWVNREALLAHNGRSRKLQIRLAGEYGIKNYAAAGGGCLLTEKLFVKKIRDLVIHKEFNRDNVELLKIGRHFRISDTAKFIVGRDEEENKRLAGLAGEQDYLFLPVEDFAGPSCLARGNLTPQLINLCAKIASYYCDLPGKAKITYEKRCRGNEKVILDVLPIEQQNLEELRI